MKTTVLYCNALARYWAPVTPIKFELRSSDSSVYVRKQMDVRGKTRDYIGNYVIG